MKDKELEESLVMILDLYKETENPHNKSKDLFMETFYKHVIELDDFKESLEKEYAEVRTLDQLFNCLWINIEYPLKAKLYNESANVELLRIRVIKFSNKDLTFSVSINGTLNILPNKTSVEQHTLHMIFGSTTFTTETYDLDKLVYMFYYCKNIILKYLLDNKIIKERHEKITNTNG